MIGLIWHSCASIRDVRWIEHEHLPRLCTINNEIVYAIKQNKRNLCIIDGYLWLTHCDQSWLQADGYLCALKANLMLVSTFTRYLVVDHSRPWSYHHADGSDIRHRSANAEIKISSTGPPTGCEHGDSLSWAKLGRCIIGLLCIRQTFQWQQSRLQRDAIQWQHSVLRPTQISALK